VSAVPVVMPGHDAVELVELLVLVADLCESHPSPVHQALTAFLGDGYGAGHLHSDVVRLADSLARAMGFVDCSMEETR